MASVGELYGRFHANVATDWFDAAALMRGGATGSTAAATAAEGSSWASCLWVLRWLQELGPARSRDSLAKAGVDWGWLAAEVAGLPGLGLLPSSGVTARTVAVHGDSHPGNIMVRRCGCHMVMMVFLAAD